MTIINGDARGMLELLADKSVHCGVTSPPYYGLRKYGTDGEIWGGDPNCQHEWGVVMPPGFRGSDTNPGPLQSEGNKNRQNLASDVCTKCGAWKGELGLEPTPDMYVQHLVEIFREFRRVLRDDGTLWLNIGDSYASRKGSCYNPGGGNENSIQDDCKQSGGIPTLRPNISDVKSWGMKPKDLIGIPWMVAFALRADGWYLRADLPWIKRNAMPSSVKDRPSSSIEHVFLLSKSKTYYYDYVAAMQPSSESYNNDKRPRGVIRQCVNENSKYPDEGQFKKQDNAGNNTYTGFNARYEPNGTGLRYMRDSDFFFRTWQGLLHNEDGEPMALVVNPRGYKGAHFACFPVQLVEPMIMAGTSERGVCPECGAPWVRDIVKSTQNTRPGTATTYRETSEHFIENGSGGNVDLALRPITTVETTGWHPTCSCNRDPVPATVLDPFAGSCAAGVACQWHNRNFIGIELKPDYCELGKQRLESNK